MALASIEDWLPVLAERLDKRRPRVDKLESYVNGNAPLPEMGKNTKATWIAFQKKSRTNFGGIACASHANRIRALGVRVGSNQNTRRAKVARRIWRDNRMPMQIADAVWHATSRSVGYLVVGLGDDGRAVITAESPDVFYAEPDPLYPWRARAGLKAWRDTVEMVDYAQVWAGSEWGKFSRPAISDDAVIRSVRGGRWTLIASGRQVAQTVFIVDRRDGLGLIEPHLDVIDRINLGKLQRLSTAAIQAFRQRALKKQEGGQLPQKDDAGNPIDWAKIFEPAPGALWDLPAGIDIWESQATDIRQMLDGEKADARDFSAVSGTPISMLLPDGANQSATGAAATTAQQVDACNNDIDRIRLAVAGCIVAALAIERIDVGDDTVEIDFADPAWVTLAEQMDAYTKAVSSGIAPQVAQREILGWSPDQIAENERLRSLDARPESA